MLSNNNVIRVRFMFNNGNNTHASNYSLLQLNINNIALPQNIGF